MTADDISGRNSRTGTKSGKCCKKKGRIGMEAAKSAANEEMQEKAEVVLPDLFEVIAYLKGEGAC